MRRKGQTRYPHAFSKGQGVRFVSEGTWRPQAPCTIQTASLGVAALKQRSGSANQSSGPERRPGGGGRMTGSRKRGDGAEAPAREPRSGSAEKTSLYPIPLDPRRWKHLRVSPTIANLYRSHAGVAVICADCLHGVGHRNPGLPDRFRRQWHLTLLELEKKCRCEMCGSKNARVYPWLGDADGDLGLEGPPEARR